MAYSKVKEDFVGNLLNINVPNRELFIIAIYENKNDGRTMLHISSQIFFLCFTLAHGELKIIKLQEKLFQRPRLSYNECDWIRCDVKCPANIDLGF